VRYSITVRQTKTVHAAITAIPEAAWVPIAEILRPRWLSRVITWQLAGQQPASLRLRWRTDPAAKRQLATELFGKRILFTDREDWPLAEVVAAYRSQADVEMGQAHCPHERRPSGARAA